VTSSQRVGIVGSVLVRNEDVFVELAIRNAASFCDVIHVVDHLSSDRTWSIVRSLARDLGHLDVRRSRHAGDSHAVLEQYAGTSTWVLGIDGDELFDPTSLATLREALLAGAHADVFRVKAHVLNCDELDEQRRIAYGYLAPPSRPVTKLFNFAAVETWAGCPQRLHGGRPVFRPGFHWESKRDLATGTGWDSDPLRCLHVCFLQRSSLQSASDVLPRRNLGETGAFRRDLGGVLVRGVRGARGVLRSPRAARVAQRGPTWKSEWYARGERIGVDATPFIGPAADAQDIALRELDSP